MASISDLMKSGKGESTSSRPSASPAPQEGNATRSAVPTRPQTVEQMANQATMKQIDRDPTVSAYDLGQPYRDAKKADTSILQDNATLKQDFSALQDGDPDAVRDWRQLAEITVQLGSVDDDEARELKNAMLWSYGDQLQTHVDAIDPEWWGSNYEERPEVEDDSFLGWKGKLKAVSDTGLFDYLDQWGQDALGVVAGASSIIDQDDGVSASDGLGHIIRSGARAVDVTRALPGTDGLSGYLQGDASTFVTEDGRQLSRDLDGDGSLNLREALGKDPEAGGRALGAIDLIGTIALDPTSYLTFGGSAAAKAGMKAVEEAAERLSREGMERISREMAVEMNQRIASGGWKALEEGEQQLYEALVRTAGEMAVEAGGRSTTRLGRDIVQHRLQAVQRGGQDGIRFAGSTVAPMQIKAPREAFGRVVNGGSEAAGEVGRRLNEIIDGIPESQWGSKVDELDDIARTQLDEVRLTSVRQGLFNPDGRVIGALKHLKPRLQLEIRYGNRISDAVGDLFSRTSAEAQTRTTDIMNQVGANMHKNDLLKDAIGEYADTETLMRTLDDALSNPAQFDEIIAGAGPRTTQLLQSLDSARTQIFEATLRGQGYQADEIAQMAAGKMPLPTNMHDINTYVPRILTEAARADGSVVAALRSANPADTGGTLASRSSENVAFGEGALNQRSLSEIDSIFGANDQMASALREMGIKAPGDLFEANIPAAFAARSKSAFEAAAEVDLLDGLTKLDGPGGQPLAFYLPKGAIDKSKLKSVLPGGANLADYRAISMPNGGTYRVHRDVASEMEDVRRVFGDPKEMSAFGRMYDQANNVWAMNATVGLLNPGFHVRNMVGNVFNMFLGGARDPSVLAKAADLQDTMRRITNRMADSGVDFETAARYLDVDARDIDILAGARRSGVLGDSRTLDMTRINAGQANPRVGAAPIDQPAFGTQGKFSLRSADSVFNRKGVQLGEYVEGNARLGLYMDQLNKGASEAAAAQHVKRYLFDYGDLTRFESEGLRRAARFYTFTRKNTAVQFHALTRYPGRVANAQEVADGTVQLAVGTPDGENSAEGTPSWMRNPILGSVGGHDAAFGIDTPYNSFEDLATMFTDLAIDDPLNPQTRGGAFFEKFESLFSGVGVSGYDFVQESITGRDSFSGRPFDGQARDSALFRAIETLFPTASRAERFASQVGATRGGEDQREWELMLLNWVGGLQVAELGEDNSDAARNTLIYELVNLQDELRDRLGAYDENSNPGGVMTITQLRDAGELAAKDQLMEALMYSYSEDADGNLQWDATLRDQNIQDLIPADVLQALGVEVGEDHGYDAESTGVDEQDLANAIRAYETWRGTPLTEEQKMTFLVASPWAPSNEMLEALGIEPYRDGNRFIEGEEEPSFDVELEQAQALFQSLASTIGLDTATVAAMRPRLSTFQRILNEAEAANVSTAELHNFIVNAKDEGGGGVLSRNDRAFMNQLLGFDRADGPVPLSTTRTPDVTAEDRLKIQTKAWEAQEEYVLFSQLYGLPAPSQEQIETYVMNSIMNSGTLADTGYLDLKGAPNREDTRTDAEKYEDSVAVQQSGILGLTQGPSTR